MTVATEQAKRLYLGEPLSRCSPEWERQLPDRGLCVLIADTETDSKELLLRVLWTKTPRAQLLWNRDLFVGVLSRDKNLDRMDERRFCAVTMAADRIGSSCVSALNAIDKAQLVHDGALVRVLPKHQVPEHEAREILSARRAWDSGVLEILQDAQQSGLGHVSSVRGVVRLICEYARTDTCIVSPMSLQEFCDCDDAGLDDKSADRLWVVSMLSSDLKRLHDSHLDRHCVLKRLCAHMTFAVCHSSRTPFWQLECLMMDPSCGLDEWWALVQIAQAERVLNECKDGDWPMNKVVDPFHVLLRPSMPTSKQWTVLSGPSAPRSWIDNARRIKHCVCTETRQLERDVKVSNPCGDGTITCTVAFYVYDDDPQKAALHVRV